MAEEGIDVNRDNNPRILEVSIRKEAILTEYIKVDELVEHPKNNEFFDDITGEAWEEFKESIRTLGVVEPVVITPDKVIVSGHQRVRACKELGIPEVLCDMRSYDSEDQVLQALIETNIRQRGTVGGSAKKVGRRIVELERIYGIKNGNNQFSRSWNNSNSTTQKDLAEKLGTTVRTIQNYKALLKMIPELEDLVDTGIVSTTTAVAIVRELSPEDQKNFIESLPEVEKLSQEKVRKLIANYQKNSAAYKETIEKQFDITGKERSEFQKEYTEASEEVENDKALRSATVEVQSLTDAINEYVRRNTGKMWVFSEFDQVDASVKKIL